MKEQSKKGKKTIDAIQKRNKKKTRKEDYKIKTNDKTTEIQKKNEKQQETSADGKKKEKNKFTERKDYTIQKKRKN